MGEVSEEPELDKDDNYSVLSGYSGEGVGPAPPLAPHVTKSSSVAKFDEEMVEVYQSPWQPSATPTHLQHRFMVWHTVI